MSLLSLTQQEHHRPPPSNGRLIYACQTFGLPDHDRCNALALSGYDVYVGDWNRRDTEYRWEYTYEKYYNYTPFHTDGAWRASNFIQFFRLVRYAFDLHPDCIVVYGYQNPAFFVLAILCWMRGAITLSMNDSKLDDYPRSTFKEPLKTVLLAPYRGVLAATARARDYAISLSGKPTQIYHCAIDTKRVATAGAEIYAATPFAERHFTVVARFVRKKNIPIILNAFERYARGAKAPRSLVLCGYGPEEAEIRRIIEGSEVLRRHVTIAGFVSADQVPTVLGGSLALILASQAEQFGIVVSEALSSGIPVIVTSQCGAADLVTEGQNGHLVAGANPDALASAIAKLDSSEADWQRMSACAAASASQADVSVFVSAVNEFVQMSRWNQRGGRAPRPRVAVIYHFFPHYRAPVLRELARSHRLSFSFWGAHAGVEGIKPYLGDAEVEIQPLNLRQRRTRFSLSGYFRVAAARDTQALVILGNPNILATWWIAALGRLTGKKVFFWTHGWLKPERRPKAILRNLYYRIADGILVYGDRARHLAAEANFPVSRIHTIYNSLDWPASKLIYEELQASDQDELRAEITPWPDIPLLICTARLTTLCRFDLLLSAMAKLEFRGQPTSLILVGDGPEKARLEAMAKELSLRVQFLGPIYDEGVVGRLLYSSDLTVSPGKVGLTAMHSLTYGTPVLTHGDLNAQMPEVEAIRPGETGVFFEKDDADDLADKLANWLQLPRDRTETRRLCRAVIEERYTPVGQRIRLEAAVLNALGEPFIAEF